MEYLPITVHYKEIFVMILPFLNVKQYQLTPDNEVEHQNKVLNNQFYL